MAVMSEEDLNNLVGLTGVSKDQATHILKLSNNDVNAAINKYFDEGLERLMAKKLDTSWDNSAFNTDRYGQDSGNGSIPTFNIDFAPGYEQYPHSGGPSGAPTRPSSRTSHRSNVSTHAADAPQQSSSPSWNMHEWVRMLTASPGVETGQESGVTGNTGAVFGPANQESYYDNASWAMVPASKSTEYVPDASQWYQTREVGAPAFIKPIIGQEYLPALLTILHTIPLYRSALLTPNVTNDIYWLGDNWWKGDAEAKAVMVDSSTGATSPSELEFIYETQRLIAFLDNTQRAYASLNTLFQLDAWKKFRLSPDEPDDLDDDLVKFLLRWSFIHKQHHPETDLDGVFRSTINARGIKHEAFVLDAPVVPNETATDRHIYDVLDAALFESLSQSAYIEKASNVLILRLCATVNGAQLNCTIPPVLHTERYLGENKAMVEKMFTEKNDYEAHLSRIDAQVDALKFHRPQKSHLPETMETLKMIKTSMVAFDPVMEGEKDNQEHANVLAELKSLYENIERKLANLEEEKEKVSDALKSVSNSFRASIDAGEEVGDEKQGRDFTTTYTLQGVATSPTDYYILHPKIQDQDPKPNETVGFEWWHIKYSYTSEDASIDRKKVTIDTVCEDAGTGIGKTLLVYANSTALSAPQIPLSTPLQDFIKADNVGLKEDIKRFENQWPDNNTWTDLNTQNGNGVTGDWYDDNNSYDAWTKEPVKEYHEDSQQIEDIKQRTDVNSGGSGISSARTLTPNTEVDDAEILSGGTEMKEVTGRTVAWADISNASSETVGMEPMDIVGDGQKNVNGTESMDGVEVEDPKHNLDVEMKDADVREVEEAVMEMNKESEVEHIEGVERMEEEPNVEHMEAVEKKGG